VKAKLRQRTLDAIYDKLAAPAQETVKRRAALPSTPQPPPS
jgi:hypothetical protein